MRDNIKGIEGKCVTSVTTRHLSELVDLIRAKSSVPPTQPSPPAQEAGKPNNDKSQPLLPEWVQSAVSMAQEVFPSAHLITWEANDTLARGDTSIWGWRERMEVLLHLFDVARRSGQPIGTWPEHILRASENPNVTFEEFMALVIQFGRDRLGAPA